MKKHLKRATIALVAIMAIGRRSATAPRARSFEISTNMEILSSVYAEVNRYYVDTIDANKLMKTGIDAMLGSLDPYTNYIPEDDIEDFRFISTGQYGGIGALIGTRNNRVLILLPYEGFPAHNSGLKVGDEILEIDGHDVRGNQTNDISKLLKGQADTEVNLLVKRFNTPEPFILTLTRKRITVKNVPYYGMINDEVGYFRLTGFTQNAGANVQEAIEKLKAQGAKKYVFDLRGNGGGLLNEAVNISSLFVPRGSEVVSMKGKVSKWNETFYTQNEPILKDEPIIILTDGRSASASEIVSGVIQDYDRGVLIGRKTYGKGLVQATMSTAYNSKVKVTTAKYYIPSGRCIQAIDYADRDEHGRAKRIPDSLLVAFKTANGRTVYDGAGLFPDIEVEQIKRHPVIGALKSKNLLFDFGTEYYYTKDSVQDPKTFTISDELYGEFKAWLQDKKYSYTTESEKLLQELQKSLEKDSLGASIEAELNELQRKIDLQKSNDLDEAKSQICAEISREISSHYYLDKGLTESAFSYDVDILKALEVLSSPDTYKEAITNN
jgi:carboxyl-terminal processing protease